MEMIHTCYRITDPERSIAFYEALGIGDAVAGVDHLHRRSLLGLPGSSEGTENRTGAPYPCC